MYTQTVQKLLALQEMDSMLYALRQNRAAIPEE
jgi:hypothetical protein